MRARANQGFKTLALPMPALPGTLPGSAFGRAPAAAAGHGCGRAEAGAGAAGTHGLWYSSAEPGGARSHARARNLCSVECAAGRALHLFRAGREQLRTCSVVCYQTRMVHGQVVRSCPHCCGMWVHSRCLRQSMTIHWGRLVLV